MSDLEVIIRQTVVAVLAGYLYHKHRQRLRCLPPPRQSPVDWNGTAIDATKLKPALARVRRDYLAGQPPAQATRYHRALSLLTQQAVRKLGFFREITVEEGACQQPEQAAAK